jgi:GT2 family glycosyltransferase
VRPAASLIVPTRNRQAFVRDLIASILVGSALPAEIVVVDQSDEPDSLVGESVPPGSGCTLVHRPLAVRGASAARNEGIRTAQNDVLVFADDDVLPTPTWFERLVSALESRGTGAVVTGRVHAGEPEARGGFAPSLKTDEQGAVYEGRAAANVLWTNNMAMFRTAVDEIGFFDERLGPGTKRFPGGGEDNDYCFRLLEAGYQIVYEPAAVVEHRAWRPAADYVGLRWRYGRGQGGFYGKHVQLRDRYILGQLTRHVVGCGIDAVRQAPREPRLAAGSAAYGAGIMTAALEWLVRERLFAT